MKRKQQLSWMQLVGTCLLAVLVQMGSALQIHDRTIQLKANRQLNAKQEEKSAPDNNPFASLYRGAKVADAVAPRINDYLNAPSFGELFQQHGKRFLPTHLHLSLLSNDPLIIYLL